MELWQKILRDESAATAVEYGLLVGFIAIAIIGGMNNFTNQMVALWHSVENASNKAAAN
ncbi:Flp family type IVb pilin [Novosphingobium sp. EMRT-2]|nr:Flp family type IVb pilin [Novosphingobium sp. EMRT-2]